MELELTDHHFRFEGALWLYSSRGAAWVFVSLPDSTADDIEAVAPHQGGFGSVPVEVTIGETVWRTSLFPDSKAGTYVLPVKRAVRVAEGVDVGDSAVFEVTLLQPT